MKKQKKQKRESKQLIVSVEKVRELRPDDLASVAGGVCAQSWGKGSSHC